MNHAPLVRRLDELTAADVSVAGGKGASLGELFSAGVRVPGGFVVTRTAFEQFLAIADPESRIETWLEDLDRDRITLTEASRSIDALLENATVPAEIEEAIGSHFRMLNLDRVSIRSSATCEDGTASAWAGQLETYLNVRLEDIRDRVADCWKSIFCRRALAYGAAHGYGAGQFAVAVVVQQMVASEVSGIGFSVHPVTQEPDVRLIEACLGQGEAIVSGSVEPDQYIVDKDAGTITAARTGTQKQGLFLHPDHRQPVWQDVGPRGCLPKLTEAQVLEYAGLLDRIEAHYGIPVDTEWALEDGVFWLLQSRPITTLAAEYREDIIDQAEPWLAMGRRPLSLAELSLISHWVDTAHSGSDFQFHLDRCLGIQDASGMVTMFFSRQAMQDSVEHLVDLDRNDRGRLIGLLQQGHEIYQSGLDFLERGTPFDTLEQAADFFIKIGRFCTSLPAVTLIALEEEQITDHQVRELCEGLRARSLYPRVAHDLVHPLFVEAVAQTGFDAAERAPEIATYDELRRGQLTPKILGERLSAIDDGKNFVFQQLGPEVRVRFLSETGYLLMRQQPAATIPSTEDPNTVRGQAAWPGCHQGRARVVLSSDPEGYEMNEGDVLISIQSNPNLMPLLKQAGAIVTDEGGVACHAGIICRELKIPTIIGTGQATSKIRDGDLVEVDATQQVVRVLERAD